MRSTYTVSRDGSGRELRAAGGKGYRAAVRPDFAAILVFTAALSVGAAASACPACAVSRASGWGDALALAVMAGAPLVALGMTARGVIRAMRAEDSPTGAKGV